jgi:two-component system, NarL family, invasion response regulator UvrY
MLRILVVDDHPLIRKGIVQTLTDELPGSLISETSNAADTLDAVQKQIFDLVLLDLSLPGRSGLELLKEIKAICPKLPVLIVSSYPEDQFAIRALRAGAAGYLNKESPPQMLLLAARRAMAGGKFLSPAIAEKLASDLTIDSSKPLHEQLSDREYDILRRVASGQAISEIGGTLNLSAKTVSTYRARLLQKMRMQTNAELIQYAIRNKLIE